MTAFRRLQTPRKQKRIAFSPLIPIFAFNEESKLFPVFSMRVNSSHFVSLPHWA